MNLIIKTDTVEEEPFSTQVHGEIILQIVGIDGGIIYLEKPGRTQDKGNDKLTGEIILQDIFLKKVIKKLLQLKRWHMKKSAKKLLKPLDK